MKYGPCDISFLLCTQFIDTDGQKESGSDCEGSGDEIDIGDEMDEASLKNFKALSLVSKVIIFVLLMPLLDQIVMISFQNSLFACITNFKIMNKYHTVLQLTPCSQDGDNLPEDVSGEHCQIGLEPVEDRRAELGNDEVRTDAQAENGHDSEEENHIDYNDPELEKRLIKQRKHAIQAARGRRKAQTARNTYKDKGGKSSNSSKLQKQFNDW